MKRLYAFAFLLLLSASAQAVECLKEAEDVSFTGKVSRETFPGPPNYESIDDGDTPETVWILTIDSPRCVVATSMEDGSPYEVSKSTTRFQLAFESSSVYQTQKSLVENEATVTGKLFVGQTGHHHTKALIAVKTMTPGVPIPERR